LGGRRGFLAKFANQMCHFAFVRSKSVTLWMRSTLTMRNVFLDP